MSKFVFIDVQILIEKTKYGVFTAIDEQCAATRVFPSKTDLSRYVTEFYDWSFVHALWEFYGFSCNGYPRKKINYSYKDIFEQIKPFYWELFALEKDSIMQMTDQYGYFSLSFDGKMIVIMEKTPIMYTPRYVDVRRYT